MTVERHLVVEAMWGLYGMIAAGSFPMAHHLVTNSMQPWWAAAALVLVWIALGVAIWLAERIRNNTDRLESKRRAEYESRDRDERFQEMAARDAWHARTLASYRSSQTS